MTTTTLTLADFLLARIAEDEEWASARWKMDPPDSAVAIRLRAECEAKRRIVETIGTDSRSVYTPFAWEILQHLATPYADHEDFREEWRP